MAATRLGLYGGPRFSLTSGIVIVTGQATGTGLLGITEEDIVLGGKTIIISLSNDTWVASGAAFNAQRQNILDGLVSNKAESTGFNAFQPSIPVTAVVRTSDTVITITLPELPSYSITADETISIDIPAAALVTSVTALDVPEGMEIADVTVGGSGNASTAKKRRDLELFRAMQKRRIVAEEEDILTAILMISGN